ncbi:Linear gramicidin synthase subunit D [Corynebacterium felinum]|uniref:Non-ribosomal peptide synthetase-like protein n=1 Tax=Corynebacterium felinum TaxID=131318 RepID=A0ABU2B5G7_9CORY|nr:non-ribosomal peptide synthetase-like protein [Corynebacterium felinum]WJY96040.1 Linear gramicidin synthase subunit D [Corynebacterium felinum]
MDDRVLAGLSVAFDASCEEMWLAWAHGACLVPAPRSLVRSGMDLGPWLIRRNITVVSTVPTLAGLWPHEALDNVRLLIFGGEACPAELVERVATKNREVWNTYGPTEATVVACAAQVCAGREVSIGRPLLGWDLAVVDAQGQPVGYGEVGELIIGGIGLARYLDPDKDKEKYAPLKTLGWARAYRSGDHVRLEEDGLYFVGRVDDQVKIGGRRIELGEVEAHVSALENVNSCSVITQKLAGGNTILVGYLSLGDATVGFDVDKAREELASTMPAALVPRLCVLDELPVTTSGKVDKKALPWPLPGAQSESVSADFSPVERWLASVWEQVLGVGVGDCDADFFALGGSSLAAATVIGLVRERVPTVSVRDLYDHPRLGALAERVGAVAESSGIDLSATVRDDAATTSPADAASSVVSGVPLRSRVVQQLVLVPLMTLRASSWVSWIVFAHACAHGWGVSWAVAVPWWLVVLMMVVFVSPLGRIVVAGVGARVLTRGITPGSYPRAGTEHLRIWAAERLADASGSQSVAGATWVVFFARLLGAKVGKGVDLHSLPPVTGMVEIGDHAAIEPEVDLSGYWVEGDQLHVGSIRIGAHARIGGRSTLLPGTVIGENAHIVAGSTVTGDHSIKAGSRWSGSPARRVGRSKHRFPADPPPPRRWWVPLYGLSSLFLSALPLVAVLCGLAVMYWFTRATTLDAAVGVGVGVVVSAPLGTVVAFGCYMVLVWVVVRVLSIRIQGGIFPVRSFSGWRIWMIERLMDDARTYLFPIYAAHITPLWLRSLGATVGKDVEISTAVMVPKLVEIRDGAFLADDTLIGGYELGGGWMLAGVTKVGKRSFVGNSAIAGPERKLAKNSLIAVLSSTPKKVKAGSSWWGSPPERMRRVAATSCGSSEDRTYQPGRGVKVARGVVETLRLLAPMTSATIAVLFLYGLHWMLVSWNIWLMWALSGLLLMVLGALAMVVTACVKWVCVGRHRPGDHPLWSRFVWLNELQDTFVEVVAAPWFFQPTVGSGAMNVGLRLLGTRIGAGAWVETYWFPETDLCSVGAGATVGPGVVVQTHLFQDRVMSLDTVTISAGATVAGHSVALPASVIGAGATVGPGSLVMRGDRVPAGTKWQGNPIEAL